MKQLKSHDYPEIYKALKIKLDELGCVMLDVELERTKNIIDGFTHHLKFEQHLYYTKNKTRFWIDGWVADKAHVTLLYGLLKKGEVYKKHIFKLINGWKIPNVEIEDIGFFPSPYPDEKYLCIVAHVKLTPELLEGHQRLEFLPHINTFAGYKPHITLCYIKNDPSIAEEIIEMLKKEYIGKKLGIKGISL